MLREFIQTIATDPKPARNTQQASNLRERRHHSAEGGFRPPPKAHACRNCARTNQSANNCIASSVGSWFLLEWFPLTYLDVLCVISGEAIRCKLIDGALSFNVVHFSAPKSSRFSPQNQNPPRLPLSFCEAECFSSLDEDILPSCRVLLSLHCFVHTSRNAGCPSPWGEISTSPHFKNGRTDDFGGGGVESSVSTESRTNTARGSIKAGFRTHWHFARFCLCQFR